MKHIISTPDEMTRLHHNAIYISKLFIQLIRLVGLKKLLQFLISCLLGVVNLVLISFFIFEFLKCILENEI